jgi:signal transduction histidine kinase
MKIKRFFLLILLSFSFLCKAQKLNLDSLLAIQEKSLKTDSIKTRHYVRIFKTYAKQNDFVKVKEYAEKAFASAKNYKDHSLTVDVYERLGLCYHGAAKYIEAEKLYLKALDISKQNNDKLQIANLHLNLGALYTTVADYNKALESNKTALDLYKSLGRLDDMSSCYMNMGNIYKELKQYPKAVEYINKANAVFVKFENGIHYGTYEANLNLAEAYLSCGPSDLRTMGISKTKQMNLILKYLNEALRISKGMKAQDLIGDTHTKIGKFHDFQGNAKKALEQYSIALKIATSEENNYSLAEVYLSLGSHYLEGKDFEKSKYYFEKSLSLSEASKLLEFQKEALEKLSTANEQLGDYKAAYQNHQKYVLVKDQILDQDKEKEITRKQLKIDFDIKEYDYKIKQEFDEKIKWILAIASTFLLGLLVIIFFNQRKTKKLNVLISEQKTELEQLGKVKDKMFSLVSHDMRSPVNALISFITILENKEISQEKLGLYAAELKNQLTQTTNLMENMLNWAASQMQGYKPTLVDANIFKLSEDVLINMRQHAALKGITILNTIRKETEASVDTEMFALIIRNLVANAIKFSKKNGTVELYDLDENDQVVISVKDSGMGIAADKLSHINTYENALIESTAGTQNEKGTGIGIMLCKTFAKLINGKLIAESQPGNGSEFKLSLPKRA